MLQEPTSRGPNQQSALFDKTRRLRSDSPTVPGELLPVNAFRHLSPSLMMTMCP
jgi:hypothetical protein